MKELKFFALTLASCLAFCNSGCFYLTGEKTYWEEEFADENYEGPGKGDIVAKNYQDVKYRENDGKCISIGILPGFGEVYRRDDYIPVGTELEYAFFIPILNCCFLVPTITSLVVEPFAKYEKTNSFNSRYGLLGAHQWLEAREHKRRIDYDPIEHVITGTASSEPIRAPSASARDGTKVYFVYPGFSAIKMDVLKTGAVDVMHEDGVSIRRFKPAKKTEGYLIFEDRSLVDEDVLKKHIAFRATCKQLKAKAAAASTSVVDNERKRRIQKLIGEIDEKLGENLVDDYTFRKLNDDWVRRVSECIDETMSDKPSKPQSDDSVEPVNPSKTGNSEFDL